MIVDRLNGKFQREFVDMENKMNTEDITNTTNPSFDDFLQTIPEGTRHTYKNYFGLVDLNYDTDVDDLAEQIRQYIFDFIPVQDSRQKIMNTSFDKIRKYGKFIGKGLLVSEAIKLIDVDKLLNEIQSVHITVPFISHSQFLKLLQEFNNYTEENYEYLRTLFLAIYEGVYSSDLKVLRNLRWNDVNTDKNFVRLNNDKDVYDLSISKELAQNLVNLSKVETYYRKARYGGWRKLEGLDNNCCFKALLRSDCNNIPNGITDFYRREYRKAIGRYLNNSLSMKNLFISGMMYRISVKFKKYNISLTDYFERNDLSYEFRIQTNELIRNEFNRCHYSNTIRLFKNLVKGYTYLFTEE